MVVHTLWWFIWGEVNLTQTRVIWNEETSAEKLPCARCGSTYSKIEKLPQSDWPVGKLKIKCACVRACVRVRL